MDTALATPALPELTRLPGTGAARADRRRAGLASPLPPTVQLSRSSAPDRACVAGKVTQSCLALAAGVVVGVPQAASRKRRRHRATVVARRAPPRGEQRAWFRRRDTGKAEASDAPARVHDPRLAIVRYGAVGRTPLEVLDDANAMDPYKVLHISFLAGRKSIRGAYLDLCRTSHPDKNGGKVTLEWRMGEWAYQMLMDPTQRSKYDSARIVRNTLSATDGFLAFAVAVATNFSSFVADVVDVAGKFMASLDAGELLRVSSGGVKEERQDRTLRG